MHAFEISVLQHYTAWLRVVRTQTKVCNHLQGKVRKRSPSITYASADDVPSCAIMAATPSLISCRYLGAEMNASCRKAT